MKYLIIFLATFMIFSSLSNGKLEVAGEDYKDGEYLKYRVHYMGLTAGYATLNLNEKKYNSQTHYHAVGKGWTSGTAKLFYKVNDRYETYINKTTLLPSKFVRKVDEGGYIKDKELTFDQNKKYVNVNNKKDHKKTVYKVTSQVQDMLSSFYYLRKMDNSSFTTGTTKTINVFMDEEIYPFKVKVLGRETIKTDYGKVKTIKLRPYVQSGRVFKEDESVTFWVTDDDNLVPVLIKAELFVGSLKAELNGYKNLKSNINFY